MVVVVAMSVVFFPRCHSFFKKMKGWEGGKV